MLTFLLLIHFAIIEANYKFCSDNIYAGNWVADLVLRRAHSRITCAAMTQVLGRPKLFSYNKSSEMCGFPQYEENYNFWLSEPHTTDIPALTVGIPSAWCKKGLKI